MKLFAAIFFSLMACSVVCAQAKPAQSAQPAEASQPGAKQAAPTTGAPAGIPGIDPAKEADIRRLLNVMGSQALMTQVMGNMEANIKPVLTNSLPPGDYRAKLVDLFFEKFMARAKAEMPSLLNSLVVTYDKHFSDEEIKGLIQFYQTPLGQKTLSAIPTIVSESQAEGEKLGRRMGLEVMQEIIAEHPEFKQAMEDARKTAQ